MIHAKIRGWGGADLLTHTGFEFQNVCVYLVLDAPLCCPPSELSSFRDISLYAKICEYEDILLTAEKGTRSYYWKWMKKNGIRDYISDIITPQELENFKAIRLSEDGTLPWAEIGFFNNGLRIKAVHQFNLTVILEYIRLVNSD